MAHDQERKALVQTALVMEIRFVVQVAIALRELCEKRSITVTGNSLEHIVILEAPSLKNGVAASYSWVVIQA